MSERYHFSQIRVGEMPQPTEETVLRRDIAGSMKSITEELVRMDASRDELAGYAAELAALADRIRQHDKRDFPAMLGRLFQGEASRQDLLDVLDFEILTGHSTTLSLPLELWLDGQMVRGKANYGVPWQGPPGRVHGGVLALTMDILLAKTQDFFPNLGMTGTLTLRYLAATPLNTDVTLEASVQRIEGRKLFCQGRVLVGERVSVEASGVWISAGGDYQWKEEFKPQ
ncbi:PaaI family thioesterase [Alcanivorax sp. 1008]|uniref:PaaI family thioesterase n=1 Tax=Alcanivorax sp. 1008 TaxID=2816853 RepID=UPI001DDF0DF2|nr:PaaI family thioesterase [Alcanivorax sp. 1008]MCC1497281.1 PaaI family thioesterase [Alcanivorax sp. 1008]